MINKYPIINKYTRLLYGIRSDLFGGIMALDPH